MLAPRLVLAAFALAACTAQAAPQRTLTAFADEGALQAYLKRIAAVKPLRRVEPGFVQLQAAAPAAAAMAAPAPAVDSVTNVQTAGVDEGGLVKVHGNHLVVLRRGRLFTVDVGGDQLKPISMLDAYAPNASPSGAWYDELLVANDTVVVIGYSYQRGGTEIGLFDIDDAGRLSYRATYQLRSNDYYSSRNYASRLIGNRLVFYTPLYLNPYAPWDGLPAMRRWQPGTPPEFKRIAPATRIYRSGEDLDSGELTLHTVTSCDLARRDMRCEATAVMGPSGRSFYVSNDAVYVWTAARRRAGSDAAVFRMPLDGGAPSAVRAQGTPLDQFSFLESEDRHLNILVRANGRGDGMWSADTAGGALALLRLPLERFGDASASASPRDYTPLPAVHGWQMQNRFVGPWLLVGGAGGWGEGERGGMLLALRWARPGNAQTLSLPHAVERIEAMGRDAVVIGSAGGDLNFTSIRLGEQATTGQDYRRAHAVQGDTRSHGFFYRQDGADDGVVALPVVSRDEGASMLYLRNRGLAWSELGALDARAAVRGNDGCMASCVDWYGNARPLFLRGRVFALMGYEVVEGRIDAGRLRETRRIDFSPNTAFALR